MRKYWRRYNQPARSFSTVTLFEPPISSFQRRWWWLFSSKFSFRTSKHLPCPAWFMDERGSCSKSETHYNDGRVYKWYGPSADHSLNQALSKASRGWDRFCQRMHKVRWWREIHRRTEPCDPSLPPCTRCPLPFLALLLAGRPSQPNFGRSVAFPEIWLHPSSVWEDAP